MMKNYNVTLSQILFIMKNSILGFLIALFAIISCKENNSQKNGNFGKLINKENAVSIDSALVLLGDKDSVQVKISGNIESVCQHSGCWMNLQSEKGEEVFVQFRDEKFSIPKETQGKGFAEGWLVKEVISIDDQKSEAKENGESDEEIAKINTPRNDYSMVVDGIIIE